MIVQVKGMYDGNIRHKLGFVSAYGCNKFWLDPRKSMLHLERQTIVHCTREQAIEFSGYALVSIKQGRHYQEYWIHLKNLIVIEGV